MSRKPQRNERAPRTDTDPSTSTSSTRRRIGRKAALYSTTAITGVAGVAGPAMGQSSRESVTYLGNTKTAEKIRHPGDAPHPNPFVFATEVVEALRATNPNATYTDPEMIAGSGSIQCSVDRLRTIKVQQLRVGSRIVKLAVRRRDERTDIGLGDNKEASFACGVFSEEHDTFTPVKKKANRFSAAGKAKRLEAYDATEDGEVIASAGATGRAYTQDVTLVLDRAVTAKDLRGRKLWTRFTQKYGPHNNNEFDGRKGTVTGNYGPIVRKGQFLKPTSVRGARSTSSGSTYVGATGKK